jgi:hypothetical protein
MINVISPHCIINGCKNHPIYNYIGQSSTLYCKEHKEPQMISIKKGICEANGCNIIANFNIIGALKGKFCKKHKESEMIDIKNKTCEAKECRKQPIFNIKGEAKSKFCFEHKSDNMIDIRHRICDIDNCIIRAHYGWLSKQVSRCIQHMQKGMIKSPTKKCEINKCNNLGTYEENNKRYCDDHKTYNAKNLGIDICKTCGLDDILFNGNCITCDPSIIKIKELSKENRIRDILTALDITFIHNKILESSSCGKERPDFQIDCGTHFLYIEVDEHQHQSYLCECEQIRMINLVESRGMPVSFIRYNPDSYKVIKGQSIITCEKREKYLIEYIKYAMEHSPLEYNAFANVLYLYYDYHDITNIEWNTLIKCILPN